jgi:hypothetical protein
MITPMTALSELAEYLIGYYGTRAEASRDAWGFLYGEGSVTQQVRVNAQLVGKQAVELVLAASDVYPTAAMKHAVLYRLAEQTGATREPDFNPTWKPLG